METQDDFRTHSYFNVYASSRCRTKKSEKIYLNFECGVRNLQVCAWKRQKDPGSDCRLAVWYVSLNKQYSSPIKLQGKEK